MQELTYYSDAVTELVIYVMNSHLPCGIFHIIFYVAEKLWWTKYQLSPLYDCRILHVS
jgi:hypothetical protein